MPMPGSTNCSSATGSPKLAAGRMCDANSLMCTLRPACRSPGRRSTVSVNSIGSRRQSQAPHRMTADANDIGDQNRLPRHSEGGRTKPLRKLSRKSELAAAFRYMRARWAALVRCFDDGRLALDNNPAERALRCVAIGRKNYLFAGSDAGRRRAAAMYSLIETAKLNGLNPPLYITDVLARIADHPARHITALLPWNWQPAVTDRAAA